MSIAFKLFVVFVGVQELSNKRSEALKIVVFFMILEGKKKEKLLYSENNFSFYYIISYRAAKNTELPVATLTAATP